MIDLNFAYNEFIKVIRQNIGEKSIDEIADIVVDRKIMGDVPKDQIIKLISDMVADMSELVSSYAMNATIKDAKMV